MQLIILICVLLSFFMQAMEQEVQSNEMNQLIEKADDEFHYFKLLPHDVQNIIAAYMAEIRFEEHLKKLGKNVFTNEAWIFNDQCLKLDTENNCLKLLKYKQIDNQAYGFNVSKLFELSEEVEILKGKTELLPIHGYNNTPGSVFGSEEHILSSFGASKKRNAILILTDITYLGSKGKSYFTVVDLTTKKEQEYSLDSYFEHEGIQKKEIVINMNEAYNGEVVEEYSEYAARGYDRSINYTVINSSNPPKSILSYNGKKPIKCYAINDDNQIAFANDHQVFLTDETLSSYKKIYEDVPVPLQKNSDKRLLRNMMYEDFKEGNYKAIVFNHGTLLGIKYHENYLKKMPHAEPIKIIRLKNETIDDFFRAIGVAKDWKVQREQAQGELLSETPHTN